MQELTLFYLSYCPYCKRAREYMAELCREDPKYAGIPVRLIEEGEQAELANSYDYWYVPTFYLGEKKLHEGAIDKRGVQQVLDEVLAAGA